MRFQYKHLPMNCVTKSKNILKNMRKVVISNTVQNKVEELSLYLVYELKLSVEAAIARTYRIEDFLSSLDSQVDYALCRFKKWRDLGYHWCRI